MVTMEDLRAICPQASGAHLQRFVEPLNAAMAEYGIDNPARQAAFLAQVAHESMGFAHARELWGPTPAQAKYDQRADLGNTRPEAIAAAARHGATPGKFFAGHGLIQTTGYFNHCKARDALGVDCVSNPELLCEPELAARSAGLFWKAHGLNEVADAGDFERITRIVNGGLNGLDERIAYYERALEALA